jgi:hypothetical protein
VALGRGRTAPVAAGRRRLRGAMFKMPSFWQDSCMRAVFRSDNLEAQLVRAFLPAHGFFVEVGAYHPVELSQTLHLEQRGWDGLLIEPVPAHAERLASRKARVVAVACGSREQHGKHLPIYVAGGHSSMRYHTGPAMDVPVVTLDSILEEQRSVASTSCPSTSRAQRSKCSTDYRFATAHN